MSDKAVLLNFKPKFCPHCGSKVGENNEGSQSFACLTCGSLFQIVDTETIKDASITVGGNIQDYIEE